ncbi:MAG: hypothetical protein HOI21_00380 [Bacteroidetes Order II. Incertae sedis bacterium]|jgi:hypothetical protein|nr:hypothetical protein [Bacteroidetes Order II. bacterium]
MSDKPLEVKGPQDLIDIIPQERITGDILRGHGPRRGGLEHLLKFWRPIMRKPGGFRRCIVILANHPELYPLQPLCAWLHHETTGKWPNEGNHHGGGGAGRAAGRVARRAIPGKRRRRRGKSEDGVEIASWRVYRRLARMDGGITTRPIGGDQNAVAYKAARFVQGLQSVPMPGSFDWTKQPIEVKGRGHGRIGRTLSSIASYFTPGDMSKYRNPVRSAMWGALFPGGGSIGPGGGAGGGARPSIGGGALRCPTGYINGGRFTDPKLTNCGGLVFDVPAKGPGAVTSGDVSKMTRRFESITAEDVPNVVRDVVVKKPKGDPFAVVREAAIRPNRAGSPARRESVVNDVVDFVGENVGTTRLVRRDGVVYEPTLSAEELVKMKDHDAIKGAVYVTSKIGKGAIAGDEIRLLSKGAEAIEYAFGQGSVRVERKTDIPVGVAAKMRTRWASISRDPDIIINPFAHVEKFVQEFSEFVEVKPKFKGVKNPNERVVVTSSDGQKRVVSRWIHHMFLSPRAPRRLSGIKPYNIAKESGTKTLREQRFNREQYAVFSVEKKNLALRPDLSDQFGKPSLADLRISDTDGMSRDSLVDLKAARFVLAQLDEDMAVKVFGRRRLRGVRLSRFARRIPKVAPYNPRARDADSDGLVQEGTIWERPSGTIFRGLKAGARKLAGSVQLVDGDGKRVDYKPGENQRSPLRTSRFDPAKRRLAGASERFGGRREQGIRRRDREVGATADFTEVELRRQARKARRERALARMRERGAGVRERRTARMERGAERDEAAAGRHAERARELTSERRDRDEFDRSRRDMRGRQRAEREELDRRSPRRERRTQRRDERRRRMQERLTEFGERNEEAIRRRDREEGARADFGERRPSVAERAAAAAERFRGRREEGIRREDRRRGARADFGKLDRERESRRRDRRGPTRRSERTPGEQRGRVAVAADRFRDRNEEAIRRRDRREGARADFGKLDRERSERRERRRRRREERGRGLGEAAGRFGERNEEAIRRRDRREGARADFEILEREREARQAARVKQELDRRAVRSQRRERIRRRVETFGERQEAAIRLRDREEGARVDFTEIELRREMRRQRVRDFARRVREINADRSPETREAGRKAARARNDRSVGVSRRFDEIRVRQESLRGMPDRRAERFREEIALANAGGANLDPETGERLGGQTLRSLGSDRESISPTVRIEEIDTLITELNDKFFDKYWDLDANGYNETTGIYMDSRFGDRISQGGGNAVGRKYDELIAEREALFNKPSFMLADEEEARIYEINGEIEALYAETDWMGVSDVDRERFEAINARLKELDRPVGPLEGGVLKGMPSVDEMIRAEDIYEKAKERRERLRDIRRRAKAGEEVDPAEIFMEPVRGVPVVNEWQGTLNERVRDASAQERTAARRDRLKKIRERRIAEAKAQDADFDPDSIDPDEWHDEGSPAGGIYDLDQAIRGMPTIEEMVSADRAFERGIARRARLKAIRKRKEAEAREVRDAGVSPAVVDQPIQNLVPTPNDSDLPGEDVLIRYRQGDEVKIGNRWGTVIRSDPGGGGRGSFYVVQFEDGHTESFPMYRVTGDSDLRRRRRAEGVERHFYPDGAIPVEDFTSQGLIDEMAMIKERWDGADVIPVEDMIRFDNLQIAWHEKNPGKDLGSVRNSRGYPVDVESVEYGDGTRADFGSSGVGGDLNSQMIRGMPSVERLLSMPPDRFDPDIDIDPDTYHDDPLRPPPARMIRSLAAAVQRWLGEDYFDAFEDHELEKAMSDAVLLIRAKNGGDLRFADLAEPSWRWPEGFLHAELTVEELFTREGIEKGLLGGVYDGDIPEGVLLELQNDHGWERDPIERVQAIVDAVLFHRDEMDNPEVFFENVAEVQAETWEWDRMMNEFRTTKIHVDNVSSREGKIRLALADRFLQERRSENIRRRNALTASLKVADRRFEPQGDDDEVDVPDSDDTFLQKIVKRFTSKRLAIVEREYERRGKGPDSMPASWEELGVDIDQILARGSRTDAEERALQNWIISTFSLGHANEFAGSDGIMWRLRSEYNEQADLPVITIDQSPGRISISFHASIEFKSPKVLHSDRDDVDLAAGEWHVSGKTDRTITIARGVEGEPVLSVENNHMYVDRVRAGVKGKGFATFYNNNAWMHVNQLGGEKSMIGVSAADDGEVVWGIQGFSNESAVANAMKAVHLELLEYKRTGKPGLIRDQQMFEEMERLSNLHSDALGPQLLNEENSPVTLGMIHAVLRREGKHPWEEIGKGAIPVDPYDSIASSSRVDVDAVEKDPANKIDKSIPAQNAMLQNAYGNWWYQNGNFGGGGIDVGGESPVGKVVAEAADRIRGGPPDADVDTPDSPRRRNRAAERRAAGRKPQRKVEIPLYRGRRRAASQLTIGETDDLGRLQLVSTSTEDSDIKTPAAAAEHIRGGGKLSDVPRELILEAVLENSSGYNNDAPDDSKLFRLISVDENGNPGKSSNPGTYGTSYIFLKQEGEPGAEQGFIIKSPDYAYESRGDAGGADGVGGSIANVSQFNEIIGRSISQLMGDPTGGVMLDGTDDSGQPYILMEFNNVVADIGHEIPLGYMNLEERTRPEMLKSRLRALLIGYSMGLGDRHGGNLLVGSEDAAASSARGVTNIDFQRAWGADTDIRAYIDGHMAEGDGFPGLGLLSDLRTAIREGKLSESELALVIDEVHEQMRQIKDVHLENIFSELSSIHELGARSRPPTAPSTGPQDVEIHASAVNDHLEMTLSVLSGGEMLLSELLADTTDEDQWYGEGQQF